ncbi:MAG: YgfZ/GcvT domain-containing protein [Vicinamibacterales bacterium]
MIPAASANAYEAARHGAAILDRSSRGRIVVSGADRASYLQGLLTNDIVALKAGQGCYAAYLTAQGRMIADLHVYELGDVILLMMNGEVKDTLLAKLDQFVFSEDVQLGDVTASFTQIGVIGPKAATALTAAVPALSLDVLRGLPNDGNVRAAAGGGALIITKTSDAGEPGYDIYVEPAHADAVRAALAAAGAVAMDEATSESIRIESGVPAFHRDMDEETIPLEAGIESRAICFTKGCYVGQEVIIRVLHRGHGRVARRLVGLRLDGPRVPLPGAAVMSGDRDVGRITSAAFSPALHGPVALAYLHREFVEPGTQVSVDGVGARVSALPFVPLA